jgi:hypothetical protein
LSVTPGCLLITRRYNTEGCETSNPALPLLNQLFSKGGNLSMKYSTLTTQKQQIKGIQKTRALTSPGAHLYERDPGNAGKRDVPARVHAQ